MTTTAATETCPAAIPTSSRLSLIDFFRSDDNETSGLVSIAAAGLLIAVAIIHLQDQGGLLGGESPIWLKYGYYLVDSPVCWPPSWCCGRKPWVGSLVWDPPGFPSSVICCRAQSAFPVTPATSVTGATPSGR